MCNQPWMPKFHKQAKLSAFQALLKSFTYEIITHEEVFSQLIQSSHLKAKVQKIYPTNVLRYKHI